MGHEHGLFRARPAFLCAFARPQPLAKSTHEATAPSGGACAVWGHNPRWGRMFSLTSGWSIKEMMRMAPAQRGHSRGLAAYTFLINSAQRCLKSDEPGGGGISTAPAGAAWSRSQGKDRKKGQYRVGSSVDRCLYRRCGWYRLCCGLCLAGRRF